MINVIDFYNQFLYEINKDENGDVSIAAFNILLPTASIRLANWLTGNFDDEAPPEAVSTQKAREWISIFIKKLPMQVQDGIVPKPDDYYLFIDLYKLKGITSIEDCSEEEILKVQRRPIELLDSPKFNQRCSTFIKRLKPENKPIAKLSEGGDFEFEPKDTGTVVLEYYRLPTKGKLVPMIDEEFDDEVPNPATSENIEWGEEARTSLLWFMTQNYLKRNRDFTLKQTEQTPTGKPKQ